MADQGITYPSDRALVHVCDKNQHNMRSDPGKMDKYIQKNLY